MPNIPGHRDRAFSFVKATRAAPATTPSNPMISPLPLDLRGNPVETLQFLLVKYTQGASNLYNGVGAACEIDWVSKVPRMTFTASPKNSTAEALTTGMDPFQRPLNPSRKASISTFFNNNDNYIANSGLIWLPQPLSVATEDDERGRLARGYGTVREVASTPNRSVVSLSIPFVDDSVGPRDALCIRLRDSCNHAGTPKAAEPAYTLNGNWFDGCPTCGWSGRPGDIIDGQHRIRGAADSPTIVRRETDLPLSVIFGEDFDDTQKAKIFIEVTVTAEKLNELHEKNLIYRSGPAGIAGFSWSTSKIAMYKTFAQLCQSGSMLEDLVALLPRNTKGSKPTGVMATVIQLLNWSEESGLTALLGGFSDTRRRNTISNWYDAIKSTIWAGQPAATMWTASRRPVGPLATPFVTESLIKILPCVLAKLGEAGITGVPTVPQFSEITGYLNQLDLRKSSTAMGLWWKGGQNARNQLTCLLTMLINDMRWDAGAWDNVALPGGLMTNVNSMVTRTVDSITAQTITNSPLTASAATPFTIEWDSAAVCTNNPTTFPINSRGHKAKLKLTEPVSGTDWYINVEQNPMEIDTPLTPSNSAFSSGVSVSAVLEFGDLQGNDIPFPLPSFVL
jgi:hypothetical protein